MTNKSTGNLILLPHLFERHVEFALEARQHENFQLAKDHLEHALAIQPNDATAMVVLLVTYHDLGLYQEAQILSESMLSQGLGEFTDVFRIYIISLVQLEQYEEVCDTVSLILKERNLTAPVYQEFQEILQTCQLLMKSTSVEWDEEGTVMSRVVRDKLESDSTYLDRLIQELSIVDFDRQLQVINQLKYIENPQSIQALREFLLNREADPVLKTFALGALKELGEVGEVGLYKWGKLVNTPIHLAPILEEGLGESEQRVTDLINEVAYHQDPVLPSFALQLWIEFFYACYPLHPQIEETSRWAAAIHLATAYSLGQQPSTEEIAELYHVSTSALMESYKYVDTILNLEKRLEEHLKKLPSETD